MKLGLHIAWRYFKARQSAQAINIVSWISMGAIALSATAMVVLFSVYNGLEEYVKSMYTTFYPEVKVSPVQGKFFQLTPQQQQAIRDIKGIRAVGYSTEDMALMDGVDHQKVIDLKGVDNEWFAVNDMGAHMTSGAAEWPEHSRDIPANIGVDIIAEMGIEVNNPFHKIRIYYPEAEAVGAGSPVAAVRTLELAPYASFNVQPELDGLYCLIPLEAAQAFLGVPGQYSAVEIALTSPSAETSVIRALQTLLGADFKVQSRLEQNATLYMVTKTEKWAIYGILLLVLIISSFNMVGSLSMLAIEKKTDVSVLKSLGAEPRQIRSVFLWVGLLLSGAGALIGMTLGLLIAVVQMRFGLITMGDGFMEAYPVRLQAGDFLMVLLTVLTIGLLAALYPAVKASRHKMIFRDE